MNFFLTFFLVFFLMTSYSISLNAKTKQNKLKKSKPLSSASFNEILRRYQFIGDFTTHSAERDISDEFFWRYPFPLPKAQFPIEHTFGDIPEEMPSTEGHEKSAQHLNYGRILYLQKNYEEARKVWLTGRSKYGKNYPFHRRADYFIGLSYLKISKNIRDMFFDNIFRKEVRLTYSNAATFLSWAFIKKKDNYDEVLEKLVPKGLYNLSAIYYLFDRYNGSHGAALEGLNYLRKTGRREYRPEFRRIIAETWIRDRQYLKAAKELDTLIRQENDPLQAAHSFIRVGDIYFDLNNYELAEDVYHIGQKVYEQINHIVPLSFILRGESLFWLGRFDESQKVLQFGIQSTSYKHAKSNISKAFKSWATLRIADSYLALFREEIKNKHLEKAKNLRSKASLAYYRVNSEFPDSEAAKIAEIRRACLNLPIYKGNNIKHARELLLEMGNKPIPIQAIELARSCEVLSYGQIKNEDLFIEKVKSFYKVFPSSQFLSKFVPPLMDIRSIQLNKYLNEKKYHKAILYYEKQKDLLYKELSDIQKKDLFLAYLETGQSNKAINFWPAAKKTIMKGENHFLTRAVFFAEANDIEKGNKWKDFTLKNIKEIPSDFKKKKTDTLVNNLFRILKTNLANQNLPWILKLSKSWSSTHPKDICEIMIPLLSRGIKNAKDNENKILLWNDIANLSSNLLPKLLKKNPNCGKALLNLELRLGLESPLKKEYGELWEKRFDWPQVNITFPLIWQSAEILIEAKENLDLAERLLTFLSKQNIEEHPEAGYAKERLNKSRMESQQLWD